MLREIKEYYDTFSSKYDSDRTRKYFNLINEMETQTVLRHCKGKNVLEVGCGTGLILKEVQKISKLGVGIDISLQMLQIASGKGLSLAQADIMDLPFGDEVFDITFSFKVLAHVPEIKKAILEIKRVTKRGGLLILEFYNPMSFKFLINKIAYPHIYQRFYSYWRIKRMIPSNLTIESFRGIRIFTIFGCLLKVPVLSNILLFLEKKFCETKLGLFGGYFAVILRKH